MKTSITVLVLVIVGSCLVSSEAALMNPFREFARMRIQMILSAFPDLADEIKSGQLGQNSNNQAPSMNPLQGLFGQGQRENSLNQGRRQNSFNQIQDQDSTSNEIPRIPGSGISDQNTNSDSNTSPSLNRNPSFGVADQSSNSDSNTSSSSDNNQALPWNRRDV